MRDWEASGRRSPPLPTTHVFAITIMSRAHLCRLLRLCRRFRLFACLLFLFGGWSPHVYFNGHAVNLLPIHGRSRVGSFLCGFEREACDVFAHKVGEVRLVSSIGKSFLDRQEACLWFETTHPDLQRSLYFVQLFLNLRVSSCSLLCRFLGSIPFRKTC